MNERIRRAKTLAALKAEVGPPGPGYQFFNRRLHEGDLTVELYICPERAPASAPNEIPEGSTFVGIVEYASRDEALRDLG